MNQEQLKSLIRTLVSTFGGLIAGWFAAKGWLTQQQVLDILSSPTFVGLIVSAIGGIWGLITHTQANAVAVVDAMPEVAGVVTKPTVAGAILAKDVLSPTVAVAGTTGAAAVASK